MSRSNLVRVAFLSFTIAQFISLLGDRLHQFSVVGMIGRIAPGSPIELFMFSAFMHIPAIALAPLFGTFIDRWRRVTVLVWVDLLRGLIVLAVPTVFHATGSLYAFYVTALFLSMANLLFSPAKSAAIPELFGEPRLLRINAVLWGVGIVGTLGGFIVGGWLFDYRTWEWSFYFDGASYLVSVAFLLPLFWLEGSGNVNADKPDVAGPVARGPALLRQSIREGLAVVRRSRPIALCLAVQAGLFAAMGVLYAVGLAKVQTVLPSDQTLQLSIVASAGTIGLLAGSGAAWAGRRVATGDRILGAAAAVLAGACMWLAIADSLAELLACALLLGSTISPLFILTETALQVHTPGEFRGRVFSTREILTRASFIVASATSALLASVVAKGVILGAVGVFLALAGLVLHRKHVLDV